MYTKSFHSYITVSLFMICLREYKAKNCCDSGLNLTNSENKKTKSIQKINDNNYNID